MALIERAFLRPRWPLRSPAVGLFVVSAVVAAACGPASLDPSHALDGSITGIERQEFRVALERGQAVTVVLDQGDVDLALAVRGPASASDDVIDMRERGRESVTVVADTVGRFIVAVYSTNSTQTRASFRIGLDSRPHSASSRDQRMQSAERLETIGKRLAGKATPDARHDALEALRQAFELWRRIDDRTGQATTLARMGDIHYASNRFEQAETVYTDALTLLSGLGQSYQMAVIENNLGVGKQSRGLLAEAREHFRAAFDLWAALPAAKRDRAATLANEGAMLVEYGDYQAALERLLEARPLLESDRRLGPAVLNNLGVAYRALGDLDAAEQYFQRAGATLDPMDLRAARLRLRLAQLALARGDVRRADADAREALNAIRQGRNELAEADALDLLGEIETAASRLDAALRDHESARMLYEKLGARRGLASALHHAGTVHRLARRLPEARAALTRALTIRREIGLRDAEAETHYEFGLLESDEGALAAARLRFTTAVDQIESVRGRVSGDYSRTVYFASRQKYFAALIELLMRLHELQPTGGYAAAAFDIADRERARSLIDTLRESGTDIRRGANPAWLEQERDEQRQLDFWASRVYRLSNDGSPEAAASMASALRRMNEHLTAYREIESRMRSSAPSSSSLASPTPVGLVDVQRQLLDGQTRLLRFVLGERRSYAWLVTRDALTVAVLPPKGPIDRAARRLLDLMQISPLPGSVAAQEEAFQRAAGELGALLLTPLATRLERHRLLIVAEGLLQLVPFAALHEPGAGTPLIVRHEIAMLPSASAIVVLRQQLAGRPAASKSVAVIADAVYEADDGRLHGRIQQDDGRAEAFVAPSFNVGRLMLSQTEADAILRYVSRDNSFAAFGFQATREAALTQLGDYRIVHFAAHAIADGARPELSALILSQYDAAGRRQRGVLRLNEITAGLTLRADVVVLSACSSAVGRDMPGEGMMGLARGFFGAGAASVVASLNTVREEPTLELMQALYAELLGSARLRPAAALRAAQLRMMASPRFGAPFYWGAFVFIGDPR